MRKPKYYIATNAPNAKILEEQKKRAAFIARRKVLAKKSRSKGKCSEKHRYWQYNERYRRNSSIGKVILLFPPTKKIAI